jgi:hypothetical protein
MYGNSPHRVEQVSQQVFPAFIASRQLVIVRIGDGPTSRFADRIAAYFSREYGNEIRLGYVNRQNIIGYPTWSMKYLSTVFASTTPQSATPDGYYLFRQGQCIAFHPGETAVEADLPYISGDGIGKILLKTLVQSAHKVQAEQEAADSGIAFFESLLHPDDLQADASSDAMTLAQAYGHLGVTEEASDGEVKIAYHNKISCNHPDKLACIKDLDEEIRAFVDRRVATFNEAYRVIMMARGRRAL